MLAGWHRDTLYMISVMSCISTNDINPCQHHPVCFASDHMVLWPPTFHLLSKMYTGPRTNCVESVRKHNQICLESCPHYIGMNVPSPYTITFADVEGKCKEVLKQKWMHFFHSPYASIYLDTKIKPSFISWSYLLLVQMLYCRQG